MNSYLQTDGNVGTEQDLLEDDFRIGKDVPKDLRNTRRKSVIILPEDNEGYDSPGDEQINIKTKTIGYKSI